MSVSLISTYDVFSRQIITALLKLCPDLESFTFSTPKLLPLGCDLDLATVLAQLQLSSKKNSCGLQYYPAFSAFYQQRIAETGSNCQHIQINLPIKVQVTALLATWRQHYSNDAQLLATLVKELESPNNQATLKLYDFYQYYFVISNKLNADIKVLTAHCQKNPHAPEKQLLVYLTSPSCHVFCLALGICLAFTNLDQQSPAKQFDLLKILRDENYCLGLLQTVIGQASLKIENFSYLYQQYIPTASKSMTELEVFAWNSWQQILLDYCSQPQVKNFVKARSVPSGYMSLLVRLNAINPDGYIAISNYLFHKTQPIYYQLVHVPLLETLMQKELLTTELEMAVKDKGARLLFDLSGEALTFDEDTKDNWLLFHQNLQERGIPGEKVFFICSNYHVNDHYAQWASEQNLSYRINVIGNNFYLPLRALEIASNPQFNADKAAIIYAAYRCIEKNERRKYKYMCLNMKSRLHRACILLFLMHKDYLKEGAVTYFARHTLAAEEKHIQPPDVPHVPYLALQEFCKQLPDGEALLAQYDALERRRPITYDLGESGVLSYEWPISQYIPEISVYGGIKQIDTYFEIVTETYFADPKTLFITEKTVRPLLRLQIFLIIGSPFTLRQLRRLGFQTFAPYINEDYDEMMDPVQRMTALLQEIDRLCAMSIDELHSLYCTLWPRILYNFNHYLDGMPNYYQQESDEIMTWLATV